MRRRAFLGGAAALLAQPLQAQTLQNAVALSGGRFAVDGVEFKLSDILAPSHYHLSESAPAYFESSKQALSQFLNEGPVEIFTQGQPNRWGVNSGAARIAGQGVTLQERMIAAGAARVSPESEDHAFISHLQALEEEARMVQRGLWALHDYRIRQAHSANDTVNGFHLIEGKVQEARLAKGRFYLNFGDDYKTDFTAGTRSANYRRWLKVGFDLETLQGARLRIRGYVVWINGPSVDLQHVKQIEVLAHGAKTPAQNEPAPAQ